MIQNLKVDIIYHSTPSDFEMEFNLCGCCRMRLLNDKTTDKKAFIKSLTTAVSRSRVIIACGPLFGAEGLIKTVAKAIGSHATPCDNATYGIKSDEIIEIIGGSTPLVTPDGYFGGCIIESGPQTIVLLTENRNFRKAIMQNLIHPYIEELCYTPTKSVISAPANQSEPVTEYITEPDLEYDTETDVVENVYEASSSTDENVVEFVMDEDVEDNTNEDSQETTPQNDAFFDNLYTAIESKEEIKERYEHPYVPSESDNMFLTTIQPTDDDYEDTHAHSNADLKAMNVSIVILVLLLLLSILALVYLVVLKPMTMGVSSADYIKEIFNIANSSTLV